MKISESQDYLSKITERLSEKGYRVSKNILYRNQILEYVARRTRFETERSGFVTTFFLFTKFSNPDYHSLRDFSANSFRYAKKASGIHLPRGLFYGILCFPVAVVNSIDNNTIEALQKKEPPKHWAAFENLVVYGLEQSKLYYCEITPRWGSLYFDRDRQTINEMLAPR